MNIKNGKVYIPTSGDTLLHVHARNICVDENAGVSNVKLDLRLKKRFTSSVFTEQASFANDAAISVKSLLSATTELSPFISRIELDFLGSSQFVLANGSSSVGLGYALEIFRVSYFKEFNEHSAFDQPIFATGEVIPSGRIRAVEHINTKLDSACLYVEQKGYERFVVCLPRENQSDVSTEMKSRIDELGGICLFGDSIQELVSSLQLGSLDVSKTSAWESFISERSYEASDRFRFFGRDKETEELLQLIESDTQVIVVQGRRGSGKSSLVKAGIFPANSGQYTPIYCDLAMPPNDYLKDDFSIVEYLLNKIDTSSADELDAIEVAKNQKLIVLDNIDDLALFSILGPSLHKMLLRGLHQFVHTFPKSKFLIVLNHENNRLSELIDESVSFESYKLGGLSVSNWANVIEKQATFSGLVFEKFENGEIDSLCKVIARDAVDGSHCFSDVQTVLSILEQSATESTSNCRRICNRDYLELGGLDGVFVNRIVSALRNDEILDDDLDAFLQLFLGVDSRGNRYFRPVLLKEVFNKGFRELVVLLAEHRAVNFSHEPGAFIYVHIVADSLLSHWNQIENTVRDRQPLLNALEPIRNFLDEGKQTYYSENHCGKYWWWRMLRNAVHTSSDQLFFILFRRFFTRKMIVALAKFDPAALKQSRFYEVMNSSFSEGGKVSVVGSKSPKDSIVNAHLHNLPEEASQDPLVEHLIKPSSNTHWFFALMWLFVFGFSVYWFAS